MKEQVGRYKVVSQLGKGAMGVVYLAEDPMLHRQVAIKTVELATDDPVKHDFLRDRLVRDARAAAGLSHPNIVGVYDVFEEEGCGYLVLEYVAGETLAARLGRTPRPDLPFVTRLLAEMASALDYTHARGIIHRDIKPSNVMLNAAGTAKIMDFGIARINDSQTKTVTGLVMGTLEYMAPEQIKGEPVDGHADQFSLAAVAYEMLTGTTLFGEQSFTTLAYKLVNEMPAPARSHNPAILPGVDEVLTRALRKVPGDRFPSCSAFTSALDRAFAGEVPASGQPTLMMAAPVVAGAPGTSGSLPVATPGVAGAPTKSKGPLIGLVAGLAAALLGVGILVWKPWAPVVQAPGRPAEQSQAIQPDRPQPEVPQPGKAQPEKARPENPPETAAAPQAVPESQSPPAETPPPVKQKAPEKAVAEPPPPPKEEKATDDTADSESAAFPQAVLDAYRHGEEMVKADRYPAAIRSFNEALSLRPDFLRGHMARGLAYLHQNRAADALADYDEVVRRNPRNALALSQRGICHARLRDEVSALADFDKSLQMRPNLRGSYNGRGLIYLHRKQYQMALHEFNEALRVSPDFGFAYVNRGHTEEAMGNTAAAQADIAKGKELNARQRDGIDQY